MPMGITAITALCMASPVRAGQSRPPHGGSGGGSSGGGTFYATVSNVTQLINDINYAGRLGGTFTIICSTIGILDGNLPIRFYQQASSGTNSIKRYY
jgi:hypothetical protein